MKNAALIGLGTILCRYAYLRLNDNATNPTDSMEHLKEAALWGLGATSSAASTKALLQRGLLPLQATAVTAAISALLATGSGHEALQQLGKGALAGSGGALILATTNPNWAVTIRPRVYASHAFRDSEFYDSVFTGLKDSGLEFYNHSVPANAQFLTSTRPDLLARLENQIGGTSALLYLATPGASARPIVRVEVEMAVAALKPVLVIDPTPGVLSRLPKALRRYSLMTRVCMDEPTSIIAALTRILSNR